MNRSRPRKPPPLFSRALNKLGMGRHERLQQFATGFPIAGNLADVGAYPFKNRAGPELESRKGASW